MAKIINTNIVNQYDGYIADAENIKGGMFNVESVDSLPTTNATIVDGSVAFVKDVRKFYSFNGTTWDEIEIGGGASTGGTTVTVGGNPVETFNADTKLDKTNHTRVLYGTDATGQYHEYCVTGSAQEYSVPYRNQGGSVKVGTPTDNDDAATKKYVDDGLAGKVTKVPSRSTVYGFDTNGNEYQWAVSSSAAPSTLAYRGVDGVLTVGTPVANNHAATKAYVDGLVGNIESLLQNI